MYIHRRHFAHCLNNHADEPLSDPYAKSFIAAYGFAVKLLNLTKTHFRLDPEMTLRVWPCWEHSVTAAVSDLNSQFIILLPFNFLCIRSLLGLSRRSAQEVNLRRMLEKNLILLLHAFKVRPPTPL